MTIGTVKWYDELQGYGYILQMDGQEIYFHYTAIAESQKSFAVGSTVTYDLIETRLGLEASNVSSAA
ncbi:MAG: cold shock domain-containing protein [Bdellovibrionales bacterium]|nr:cold shock domain-containing protein [Bdellovibrionales bacterium]